MATDPDLALPFTPAPIRRAAPEPLYAQVARDLAGHVRAGTMAPGRRLPAEPVLARAYGVNRLTVREALTSLARQGLVRRVQGVGSFVADAPVRHRVEAGQASIAGALRGQGLVVREERAGGRPRTARGGARRPLPGVPRPGDDPLGPALRGRGPVVAVADLAPGGRSWARMPVPATSPRSWRSATGCA